MRGEFFERCLALPFEIHRLPDISMVPVRVDARDTIKAIRGGVRLRGNKKSLIIDQGG